MKSLAIITLLACLEIFSPSRTYGRNYIDSLVAKLDSVQTIEEEIAILHDISSHYLYTHPRLADSVARYGLKRARQGDYPFEEARMLYQMGLSYSKRGFYRKALENFQKAQTIYTEWSQRHPKEEIRVAFVLNQIGIIRKNRAEYALALEAYEHALEIKERFRKAYGSTYDITTADTYNNIGVVYEQMGIPEQALAYYQISEKIHSFFEKQTDMQSLRNKATVFGNMLDVSIKLGRLQEAEVYLRKTLHIHEQLKDRDAKAAYFVNNAIIYQAKDLHNKAIVSLNYAYELYTQLGNQYEAIRVQYRMGDLYLLTGKWAQAQKCFEEGQLSALDIDALYLVAEGYRKLSEVYESQDKVSEALINYKLCTDIEAEIFKSQTLNALKEAANTIDLGHKQNQIKLLSLQNELQSNHMHNQRVQKLAILIILVLTVIILLVLMHTYRRNQLMNKQLAGKNKELEVALIRLSKTVDKLRRSEADLKASNTAKNKLFSVISHDLRGQLGGILTFASLLKDRSGVFSPHQLSRFTGEFYQAAAGAFDLFENLLQWSKSQMKQVTASQISLRQTIKHNVKLHEIQARVKLVRLRYDCSPDLFIHTDINILNFLLRNLISNAVKFSMIEGEIMIEAKRVTQGVRISVTDQGMGMSEEVSSRLFKPEEHPTTVGTNNEKGAGLGLLLCQEFIEKMGSSLEVRSELGKGTTFSFLLKDLLLEHPRRAKNQVKISA